MTTQSRYAALFASWMAFFIVLAIALYQKGFGSPVELLLKSLGLLHLLIHLPILVFPRQQFWWQNTSFLSFILLFLIGLVGYACRFAPFLSAISYLLALMGIALWLRATISNFKYYSWKGILTNIFISALLGTYFLAYFYSKDAYSPIAEQVIAFFEKPYEILLDATYHSSVAKMIQSYQVLTTGVEGVVSMDYNVVSHWLFAQLSLLFGSSVPDFYHLLNPIIFFPFFIYTFLALLCQVYVYFLGFFPEKNLTKLFSVAFWIGLLCLLFPIPDSIYARGLLGLHFVQSPVYTPALAFLWCFVGVCLSYFQKPNSSVLFLWVVFPVFLFLVSYTHVAAGVALVSGTGYVFLRFQLFKFGRYWLWIFLQVGILFLAYWLTAEVNFLGKVKSSEGGLDWFFFFRQEGFVWWDFILGLYLPLLLITAIQWKKISLSNPINNQAFFLELVWAVALGGLMPNIVLVLHGSTGMYFMSVQRLLAGLILLAYLPFWKPFWRFWQASQSLRYLAFSLIAGFVLLFYMSYRNTLNDSWKGNIATRKRIMGIEKFDWKANHFVEKLFTNDPEWAKAKQLFGNKIAQKASQNNYFRFVRAIERLDTLPISEKAQSLLYIPFHKISLRNFDSSVVCGQVPFHLTALSGLALLGGIPKPSCAVGAYGYGYLDFTLRDKVWKEGLSKEELVILTRKRGFRYLYCFKPEDYSFEKIICKNQE